MNKLIIASAGSGKTTFIVEDSINKVNKGFRVLITTFTEACEQEIKLKIIKQLGYIPKNLFVQTWFSFLINHGVKPFQGCLFDFDIKGMLLVNATSGIRFVDKKGNKIQWDEEKHFERHYFAEDKKIYSDKLAKLVLRCNAKSKGKVLNRLSKCFTHLYIDEVQDLAGFDLEVLEKLFLSSLDVLLVGDPRQAVYSTSNTRKLKKFQKVNIIDFFRQNHINVEKDEDTLRTNYRCFKTICEFSNKLYTNFPLAIPNQNIVDITDHLGVFVLSETDLENYLHQFKPIQLRENRKRVVNTKFEVYNFREAKGLSFERVVIYPSKPMVNWLKNNTFELTDAARAKFYIALTRAIKSVAIVLENNDIIKVKELTAYKNSFE